MNWRWLLFDFIDPAFGLSRPERWKILFSAMASKGTNIRVMLWCFVAYFLSILVSILPIAALFWSVPEVWPDWISNLFLSTIPLIFYLFFLFALYRALCKPLRWAMQRHGYEYCRQCARPLIDLGKDIEQCPKCEAKREPLTCQSCGYDLTGQEGDPPSCPECGDSQKKYRNPSRWWWLRFQQVDLRFRFLPVAARKRIRKKAWNKSMGRFLIAIVLLVAMEMALILIIIQLDQEEKDLPDSLGLLLGLLFDASIVALWCLFAASLHKTFGASCRNQYHELGYDLCLKCGRMRHKQDKGSKICPDCNAPYHSLPGGESRWTGLPSQEELKAIDESFEAVKWIFAAKQVRFVFPMVLFSVFFSVGGILFGTYANNVIGWTIYAFAIVSVLIAIVYKYRSAFHQDIRKDVRTDLHEKGHDLCLACGFWFTQLDETPDQCPECGRKREKMPKSTLEEDVA